MSTSEGDNNMKMRSIYVASAASNANEDAEAACPNFWGKNHYGDSGKSAPQASGALKTAGNNGGFENGTKDDTVTSEDYEDLDESEPEPLSLPESTHTLFFTQPLCSIPVAFATIIVVISIMCLAMALVDNLESNYGPGNPMGVPANISGSVRIAQYLAILIALLMEEEIPTGLHLLRMIPSSSFEKKFPDRNYRKFVAAALLRIVLGYIFLINVFVILAQATGVLDIFYDVLALQFISELDDMAFALAKVDVFGKRLQRACTAKLFQTEFEKQKFGRSRKASVFLKSIYFLNLGAFLGGMLFVTMRQTSGHFQCKEITIDFGEGVWEDPLILMPDGSYNTDFTLIFSYFNGVYKQDGTSNGRPVYKEMRKFDREPFDDAGQFGVIPAVIKYSEDAGSWIFTHPLIKKSTTDDPESESWLLRSPETTEYDLLDVPGDWSIWLGVIDTSTVSYSCNRCNEDTDCNLNGNCIDGKCMCNRDEGADYLGTHCQVKLKESCGTISSEDTNVTYAIEYYSSSGNGPADTLFEEYNRPVYTHVSGYPGVVEGDNQWLIYTGRRWFGLTFNVIEMNATIADVIRGTKNFHAFWTNTLSDSTIYISDPTTGDNPVGVDFYVIEERGEQFGPFGSLIPLQKNGQEGRGLFRCIGRYDIARNQTQAI